MAIFSWHVSLVLHTPNECERAISVEQHEKLVFDAVHECVFLEWRIVAGAHDFCRAHLYLTHRL